MASMSMRVCECCREKRSKANERPRVMVMLPRSTELRNFKVLVCEHCDGPTIEFARKFAA